MNSKYIIQYCPRDKVWLVCRKTHIDYKFKTVAECFTEESAELLYGALMKNEKKL